MPHNISGCICTKDDHNTYMLLRHVIRYEPLHNGINTNHKQVKFYHTPDLHNL